MAGWTIFANHRDIFKGNIGTCSKRQRIRSSKCDTWRVNMGTHYHCKEQASNRTNKYGNEYVKHHRPG